MRLFIAGGSHQRNFSSSTTMIMRTIIADDEVSTQPSSSTMTGNASSSSTSQTSMVINTTAVISSSTLFTKKVNCDEHDEESDQVSLELQRYSLMIALTALIVYTVVVNLLAIATLLYGLTSRSAAVTIRMVCLRKKPVRIAVVDSPRRRSSSASDDQILRRSAVVTRGSLPDEDVTFDCTAFPYLLSLAFSDFLTGFLIAPLQLDLYLNHRWRFSSDLCDFWLALDILLSTSSTLHTAAIAVDRWWTLTQVQAGKARNPKFSLPKTMLIFIWMLASLVSFPVIYLWQIETPGEETQKRSDNHFYLPSVVPFWYQIFYIKQCEPVSDDTYILLSIFVSFILPLALTVIFYIQTALRISRQYQMAKVAISQMALPFDETTVHAHQTGASVASVQQIASIVVTCRAETIRLLERYLQMLGHHRAMLRTMSLIVVVYCSCWGPVYVLLFTKAVCNCFDSPRAQHTWGHLVSMLSWLGYANSGINPIIYFVALPEFKALALALVWMILERLRSFSSAACSRLKAYISAVFCCLLRRFEAQQVAIPAADFPKVNVATSTPSSPAERPAFQPPSGFVTTTDKSNHVSSPHRPSSLKIASLPISQSNTDFVQQRSGSWNRVEVAGGKFFTLAPQNQQQQRSLVPSSSNPNFFFRNHFVQYDQSPRHQFADCFHRRSQSSYAAFTDSWGRPVNVLSAEATV